jgi:hypothetical protein
VIYVCLMLRMFIIGSARRRGLRVLASLFGLSLLVSSCGLVDSPEEKPAPVNDVREYYFTLDVPADHHVYYTYVTEPVVKLANSVVDTLRMEMEGKADDWQAPSPALQVYECAWQYSSTGYADYYYAMSADTAYYLGYEFKKDTWQDLVGPLTVGKTWTFTTSQSAEPVTATVTRVGVQASVRGKVYKDIIEVKYQNADVSKTKWFAKGIGVVYTRADSKLTGSDAEQTLLDRTVE